MSNNTNTISVVSEARCTGCGACMNACPVGAISMRYNKEGFLFPVIDEERCVQCGKCLACCPEVDFEKKTQPLLHPQGKSYAVMASDEIRRRSSSGGMFTLLADYVLSRKGVVFGAAYAEDCLSVHHISIESESDLDKLRSSKYVQSGIEETYRQAKEALEQERFVLFTGCPCQIAGLYRYLGKDDPKLLTADLICHAANSTLAYQSYLKEIAKGRTVSRMDFREKANFGWITNVNMYFSDGSSYIEDPDKSLSTWYIGFLKGIINRLCCSDCHYTKLTRVGDFTLGDFWKCTWIKKEWNDKLGTSLVFANTEKADKVLEQVKPTMKLCEAAEIDAAFADKANGQLVRPTKQHKGRSVFFANLPENGYHKALAEARKVVPEKKPEPKAAQKPRPAVPKGKYDVGITGYWWSTNYGSVATYYALYKLIEGMGLRPVLIDRPEKEKHGDGLDVFSRRFMEKRLETTESLKWDQLDAFNDLCDTFVIGSDQVWGPGAITAYKYFFFLDFIKAEKKKIAYAASFGEHFNVEKEKLEQARKWIREFDSISVREYQAVDICRKSFDRDAAWVMDPVFLLDVSEYDKLAAEARRTEADILGGKQDYIVSYILNPEPEKREMILEASRHFGLPCINILHGKAHSFKENNKIMNLPNTPEDITEEEWLYLIKHAKFVITDSHHGSALSLIYNKQFICCSTKKWGQARYESLFGLLDIKGRQSVKVKDMLARKLLTEKIDYDKINRILRERADQSMVWLTEAILGKQAGRIERLYQMNRALERRVAELEKKLAEEKK